MTSAAIHPGDEPGSVTKRAGEDDAGDEAQSGTPESPPRPWKDRLFGGSAKVAYDLNERFVALARRADHMVRRAERAVTDKLWGGAKRESEEGQGEQAEREEQLVRWARVRLSELHLRIGQSLYKLEEQTENGEDQNEAIRRQLLALLAEIDRLEGILSRAGSKPISSPLSMNGEEAESLLSQLEVEPGDETEGI